MAEAVPRNNIRRYKVLFNVGLLFHAVLLAPIVTKVVVEVGLVYHFTKKESLDSNVYHMNTE